MCLVLGHCFRDSGVARAQPMTGHRIGTYGIAMRHRQDENIRELLLEQTIFLAALSQRNCHKNYELKAA